MPEAPYQAMDMHKGKEMARESETAKAGTPYARKTVTALVADDHCLLTEGLQMVLERGGIRVVGVANTGKEAVQMVLDLEPDVVLLDIRMPDLDGFEALSAIKRARPGTSVLMLTSYASIDYLEQAVARGATGFLTKEVEPRHIPDLVRAAASNELVVDRQLMQKALSQINDLAVSRGRSAPPLEAHLTGQETRILQLVAEGLSNARIAEALGLSPSTVKNHMHSILVKLNLPDRTRAAVWALRHGVAALCREQ